MIRNFVLQNAAPPPGANLNVTLGPQSTDRATFRSAYADGSSLFYFLDDGQQSEWGVGSMHWGTPDYISRDMPIGNTLTNQNPTPTPPLTRITFSGATQAYNEIPGERLAYINSQVLWAPGAHLDSHAGGVPIGASMDYWGVSAPAGWVFCDGRWLNRTTYALLFAVIGTTYGAGDGATAFAVPDCQGAATYGKNIPAAGGVTNNTRLGPWQNMILGGWIGDYRLDAHTHGLNWWDPGHAHAIADPGHAHGVADPGHVHAYRHVTFPGGQAFASGSGNIVADEWVNTDDGNVRGTGIGIYAAATGIGIYGNATGIQASVATGGTGVGWQNVSPGIVCNKIIYAGPVP